MAVLNIGGQKVTVGDEFLSLSPEEQNATVEEIAASLGGQDPQTQPAQQPAPQQTAQEPAAQQATARNIAESLGPLAGGPIGLLSSAVREPLVSMASSAVAEPLAGLAGLLSLPFVGAEGAAENVEAIQKGLTFQPRTQVGQALQQAQGQAADATLGAAGRSLKQNIADPAAEFVGENVSPEAGAAVGAALVTAPVAAAELLGLKGLRTLRGKKQITGITDEAAESLKANGLDIDDLSDAGVAKIQQAVDADVNARAARFQEQGIRGTTGDLTQKSVEKAREAKVLTSFETPGNPELVALRIDQTDTLAKNLEELRDTLGNPEDVGDTAKTAAKGLKKDLTSQKNALYDKFAQESPELANIPVDAAPIKNAVPDNDTLIDIATATDEARVTSVLDVLTKYGVVDDAASVERYLSGTTLNQPNKITPLNAANHDRFRKAINAIPDPDGKLSSVTAPIKNALDGEIDFVDSALRRAGADDSVLGTLNEARSTFKDLKSTFDPKRAADKIIASHKGGNVPKVESSKVFESVARKGRPVEEITELFDVFDRAGDKGKVAIGNFQAKAATEILDGLFDAKSRNVDGRQLVSNTGFDRAVKAIGDDKLDVIFRNNPRALKQIRDIGQTIADTTPSSFEVPKGSASVILDLTKDLVKKGAAMKGVGMFVTVGEKIAKGGEDARIIQNALEGNALQKKVAVKRLDSMKAQMPNLYKALAIGELLNQQEQEQ